MLTSWEFQIPTRIRFGRGELAALGTEAAQLGRRAMLVGYRDRTGLEQTFDRATETLEAAGIDVTPFFEIPPDPDATLVAEGAKIATEAEVDVVVGLGGGSAIDAAKGVAALVRMGGSLWDYTGANPESRQVDDALPVIAVPTTAGTGSEVSRVAVFTHDDVGSIDGCPIKASVSGLAIHPRVALVDPDLTIGSPSSLTAACGADALGHATESCMSRRSSPLSSLIAGHAVGLIVANLECAVKAPDDPEPREALSLAATLAGVAFSAAGVTMTHAIAQAMGGVLHIPHGVGVAIGTPVNLRYNAQVCTETYARLADCCSISGDTTKLKADAFVTRVENLLQSVGLPDQIEQPVDAPDDLAARLARNAIESTPVPLQLNPREVDEQSLVEIFGQLLR